MVSAAARVTLASRTKLSKATRKSSKKNAIEMTSTSSVHPTFSILHRIAVSVIAALVGFLALYIYHIITHPLVLSTSPTFLPGGIPSYSTALASFERLGIHQRQVVRHHEQAYRRFLKSATPHDRDTFERILNFSTHFERSRKAVDSNEKIGKQIARLARRVYADQLANEESKDKRRSHWLNPTKVDKRRKFSTQPYTEELNHLVRDWSTQGKIDRNIQFGPILSTLEETFPVTLHHSPRVLVPGAGLGRLAFHLSSHGYDVEMNEIDPASLMVLHWLCDLPSAINYHPFLLEWSHQHSAIDRYQSVTIPDSPLNCSSVKLIEGSFLEKFQHVHEQYDVVVTLFFIDIVPNLPKVLSMINSILKKGGIWINLGPFKYGPDSLVKLSYEEVMHLSNANGLEIDPNSLKEISTLYGESRNSLYQHWYKAKFWKAQKKF